MAVKKTVDHTQHSKIYYSFYDELVERDYPRDNFSAEALEISSVLEERRSVHSSFDQNLKYYLLSIAALYTIALGATFKVTLLGFQLSELRPLTDVLLVAAAFFLTRLQILTGQRLYENALIFRYIRENFEPTLWGIKWHMYFGSSGPSDIQRSAWLRFRDEARRHTKDSVSAESFGAIVALATYISVVGFIFYSVAFAHDISLLRKILPLAAFVVSHGYIISWIISSNLTEPREQIIDARVMAFLDEGYANLPADKYLQLLQDVDVSLSRFKLQRPW